VNISPTDTSEDAVLSATVGFFSGSFAGEQPIVSIKTAKRTNKPTHLKHLISTSYVLIRINN